MRLPSHLVMAFRQANDCLGTIIFSGNISLLNLALGARMTEIEDHTRAMVAHATTLFEVYTKHINDIREYADSISNLRALRSQGEHCPHEAIDNAMCRLVAAQEKIHKWSKIA